MVAQVQETILRPGLEKQRKGKPLVDTKTIGELGYDLALFGVTPLQSVMGTLMSVADQFYQNNGIIGSNLEVAGEQLSMIDFDIVKQIVGFDELEDFERKYPCEKWRGMVRGTASEITRLGVTLSPLEADGAAKNARN
eukprot:CCRYP_011185-RC/>CCRYP_011185-RC protein AED:0.45 eAED:0.59 QI:0/0/0/1/1/1/2/0/137